LDGTLRAKDLLEAWRASMQDKLGVSPGDDRDGCLQDVHWYAGMIGGGFQSYTIGNILSAQFHAAAVKAHPEIPREIEAASSARCIAGSRIISISTAANSRPTNSSPAPPAQ